MCGIAGIISKDLSKVTQSSLRKMTDALAHRGPDGHKEWICPLKGQVGLAHRRLSIIDLSHDADQPMVYLGKYWITFNGEIYNYLELKEGLKRQGYHFNTSSDTEVILALYDKYGKTFLNMLDGMFAVVLYDQDKQTVFCARDFFGEKPFYYHVDNKSLVFASEMKAIHTAGIPKSMNDCMVYNYLQYGAINNPEDDSETLYSGIKKLPKAHLLLIDLKEMNYTMEQYYSIPHKVSKNIQSIGAVKEELKALMMTSVERRLRSDVNVGSSLSGGLDSSLIVALINSMMGDKSEQFTFSAVFPGFAKDEGKYQDIVVNHLNNIQQYKIFPSSTSFVNNLQKILYHQEEPFISTSVGAQYEVFQSVRQNNVTVVLDGQGADELFAGYHGYYKSYFAELSKNNKELYKSEWNDYTELLKDNQINKRERKGIKEYLKEHLTGEYFRARYARSMSGTSSDLFEIYSKKRYLIEKEPKSLMEALTQSTNSSAGLENLLRYADRNSMSHSVEVRLPFLSKEIVDYAFSLPSSYKINQGWTKYILRASFDSILPKEIIWRKDKVGYEGPQNDWMQTKLFQDLFQDSLSNLENAKYIDKKKNYDLGTTWKLLLMGQLIKGK